METKCAHGAAFKVIKPKNGLTTMRASQVLQKCLHRSLSDMHALRERALLRTVEALLAGRRLTLIDVARAWPGAMRVRAPLKASGRLLGNR